MKKRTAGFVAFLLCLLIFFLFAVLLTGCDTASKPGDFFRSKEEKEPAAEVSVGQVAPSLLYLPLYAAVDEGFFEQENLRVNIETAGSRESALQDVLSKKTPILFDYPETLLYQIQQGNAGNLVCFAQTAAATGSFLLARDNKKPFAWQDLKNKVIIGDKDGELPEMVLEYILRNNDLKPHQNVSIIQNLPYRAAGGVFQAGTGHYILAAEPLASQLEKENAAVIVASIEPSAGPLVSAACITSRDYLAAHRETCLQFTRALYAGQKWLDEHAPEEITALAVKYFPQAESTLLRAVSRYKTLGIWTQTPLVDQDGFERLQEIMLYEKELNEQIPPEQVIDNSIAAEACQ